MSVSQAESELAAEVAKHVATRAALEQQMQSERDTHAAQTAQLRATVRRALPTPERFACQSSMVQCLGLQL